MGTGGRQAGGGRVNVRAMLSCEPFTVQALGSPQVFQTGETYRLKGDYGAPASFHVFLRYQPERTGAHTAH